MTTPKLSFREKKDSLYPYYAGFSASFVYALFDYLNISASAQVLDPWNGSGTTTFVASTRSVQSYGYDINPVSLEIARARSATVEDLGIAQELWTHIKVPRGVEAADALDQCAVLFRLIAAARSRGTSLATAHSIIITALFRTVRRYVTQAQTKNPSWYSSKALAGQKVRIEDVFRIASEDFNLVVNILAKTSLLAKKPPRLRTLNFLRLRPRTCQFEYIITSPPYLTRLDYVKATLPELALLSRLGGTVSESLRLQMIGSPLVGPVAPKVQGSWGTYADEFLRSVTSHPSKASSTYYLRFFRKYFGHLASGIRRMSKMSHQNGLVCMVVQDSYYKEINIDLARIVKEMAFGAGLNEENRFDYFPKSSIRQINQKAHGRAREPVESLLIFRKERNGA